MWPPAGLQTITEHEIKKPHFPAVQPTDSTKHNPSFEANSSLASQESPSVIYA